MSGRIPPDALDPLSSAGTDGLYLVQKSGKRFREWYRLIVGAPVTLTIDDTARTAELSSSVASGITVQDEDGNVATGVTQLDFQGAGVTAAAGTGEVIVTVPGSGGGSGSGGVLASTAYNPGTITSYPISSATVTDIDTTNLAVTFTAPSSGIVIVTLSALATAPGGTANYLSWALREGTTTVQTHYALGTTNGDNISVSVQLKITGLTPGSSHTYKWAQSRTGTGTANTHAGGIAGPAVMKVEAA